MKNAVNWIIALGAFLCGPALGASFQLADGSVVEGEVKRQTPTSVTIIFDEGGVGTFERSYGVSPRHLASPPGGAYGS